MLRNFPWISIVAGLFVAAAAAARDGVQSQRFVARRLPLDATPKSSALAAIWQDRLTAERARLEELTKTSPGPPNPITSVVIPVFEASFRDGDATLIASAFFTTPECRNFSGAAAPSLNTCPIRVARLRDGQIKLVGSVAEFAFVAALKAAADNKLSEYDNESSRDKTLIVFDPATREMKTVLTLDGLLDTEKSPPLHLAY